MKKLFLLLFLGCSSHNYEYVKSDNTELELSQITFKYEKNPCERSEELNLWLSRREVKNMFGEPYAVSNDGRSISWEYNCSDYYSAGRLFLEFEKKNGYLLSSWNTIRF